MPNQDTKQYWLNDDSAFELPARRVDGWRVALHVLFWGWDGLSAYNSLDRLLRVDLTIPPDPSLFRLMLVTHLLSTFIVFYSFGYWVVPTILKQLVSLRATGKVNSIKVTYAVAAVIGAFLLFNVYDYYLFTYAAAHYKPNPPYIQRLVSAFSRSGPFGILQDFSLQTLIWAYNVSYVLLPLLLKTVREAVSWGVTNVEQRGINQQLMSAQLLASEQSEQLIKTQLQVLQYQINPHFLFNVFNNIYALIQRTNVQAAGLLNRLSNLMRYALYETKADFVTLGGEIDFIKNYVTMEQSRHLNPHQINFTSTGPYDGYLIPPLLLVTFVENAFKHGLGETFDDGWININLSVDDHTHTLSFVVTNSRPEITTVRTTGGMGLANARRRLDLLFQPADYSVVVDVQLTQYTVRLQLPLKQLPVYASQLAH